MALRRLRRHFAFICRSLTLDDTAEARAALRERVRMPGLDWRQVLSLAGAHFVLPALWTAYSRKSMTADLPPRMRDELAAIHWRNVRRNQAIRAQAEEAVAVLNAAEIAPVLLKGAIHLFEPNFGDPGARTMRDLDILVPGVEMERAAAALIRLGYKIDPEASECLDHRGRRDRHRFPRLIRPGAAVPLELHRSLGARGRPATGAPFLLDTADMSADVARGGPDDCAMPELAALCDARPLGARGLTLAGLSPEHRICHAILQSELQHRHHALGVISLKELLDLAAVREGHGAGIDWPAIRDIFRLNDREAVLDSFYLHAARCFSLPLPDRLGHEGAAQRHAWRCGAQMSFRPAASATALWAVVESRFGSRATRRRHGDRSPNGMPAPNGMLASQRLRHLRQVLSVEGGGPLSRLRHQYRKAVSETLKYGPEAL